MNWYITKIVFQIINGITDRNPNQFDEQIRLIQAGSANDAYNHAQKIGRQEEESFLNKNRETVMWKFIAVKELQQVDDLRNGTELYYFIKEVDHPDLYINSVKAAAHKLKDQFVNRLIAL